MGDETKLDTPQLVDAWVWMYCAETGPSVPTADAAVADAGIAELRKRLPVKSEAPGDADMRLRVETVLEEWTLAVVAAPDELCETVSDMANEVRAAMRGGADVDPQPTQRTAKEWRAECEKVAGEIGGWFRDGGGEWAVASDGVGNTVSIDFTDATYTESDALEQLHAALCKRLEQKRRREGGDGA